jgi:hypothetical protein
LHFAAKNKRFAELKEMIINGGNPFLKNKSGQNVENLLKDVSADHSSIVREIFHEIEKLKRDIPQETNESLLHEAARKNNLGRLKLLHQLGAPFESFNMRGQRPRDVAEELGFNDIVKFIDGITISHLHNGRS